MCKIVCKSLLSGFGFFLSPVLLFQPFLSDTLAQKHDMELFNGLKARSIEWRIMGGGTVVVELVK